MSPDKLLLRESRLGVNSCMAIAKNMKDFEIRVIDLSGNSLRASATILHVPRAIALSSPSAPVIGDIGCMAIMQLAKVNATLEELNLQANNIGDEGAVACAQELESNDVVRARGER